MLLARYGWAAAAFGRLGLGACEGEGGRLVLSNSQWRFKNSCYRSYRKMNSSKDWPKKSGENKKRKFIAPVLRPTSIQSSSAFSSMESIDGYHLETKSTSDSQIVSQKFETVCDITRMRVQSSTVDCSEQTEVSEERSVMSVSTEAETVLNESKSVNISVEKELKEETSYDLNTVSDTLSIPENVSHSLSVEVGSLARFVKGKCGFTQRRIEEEFGVKIIFPSSKIDSSILLRGGSSDSVTGASEKIKSLLDEAIKRVDFSHFVSLPLAVHEELVKKATDFQNTILGEATFVADRSTYSNSDDDCVDNKDAEGLPEGAAVDVHRKELYNRAESDAKSTKCNNSSADMGIDKSIFLKPKQLHLTVLMLKLHKKDRIALAAKILQEISPKVMDALGHQPVSIRLKGLACMRGSPAKAHVLYVPVEEIGGEERLTRACQVIIDAYLEAGLVLKEDVHQTLKLHATLMNTRQQKRKGHKKMLRPDPFDARDIFNKYGSMEWGEYVLPEVHLSQRFIYDDNGYYHCCGSIPLPGSIVS